MCPLTLVTASAAIFCCVMAASLYTLRKGHNRAADRVIGATNNAYRQTQALLDLYSWMKPTFPMSPMRGWAISPDFAGVIVSQISLATPKLVLELGSGVSTVVTAYALRRFSPGAKLFSMEHDEGYAASTHQQIKAHGLEDIVSVIYCPLKTIGEEIWYDVSRLPSITGFGLLVVDGPPGTTPNLARYPALPRLHERLAPGAVILVDDGSREDEKRMVEMWAKDFPDVTVEFLPTEKGAFRIHWPV